VKRSKSKSASRHSGLVFVDETAEELAALDRPGSSALTWASFPE
jgi:hypothetical protein